MPPTTLSGPKRRRSFSFDPDVMAWLERLSAERRTNPNALANQMLAALMEANKALKNGEAA